MKKILFITALSLIVCLYFAKPISAQDAGGSAAGCKFTGSGEERCQLENPIGDTEVSGIIRTVITAALGVMGVLTLAMFIWGGSKWLFSAGNPEMVSAGTKTMIWAFIGVLVVLLSYVLLSGFLKYFTPFTG